MSTLLLFHPAASTQDASRASRTAGPHPCVERALEHERFSALVREPAPVAEIERSSGRIPRFMSSALEDASPEEGLVQLDKDTSMSPGTLEAALRAAGGAFQAVDEVMTRTGGERLRRRCARPATTPSARTAPWASASSTTPPSRPGTRRRARRRARRHRRLGRPPRQRHAGHLLGRPDSLVLLDPRDAALSRHRRRVRARRARYHRQRAAFARATAATAFREAFECAILPRIEAFGPDLIIISAGFDAHWRDPLAELKLTEADFAWATKQLMDLADRRCDGRVVSLLEGGYDLEGLATSAAAHVDALMGHSPQRQLRLARSAIEGRACAGARRAPGHG